MGDSSERSGTVERSGTMRRLESLLAGKSALIATVAGVCIVVLLGFGIEASSRFRAVNDAWARYSSNSSEMRHALGQLQTSVGYGGLIHNFKNYILRRDKGNLDRIAANHRAFRKQVLALRGHLKSPEEREALDTIERTIDEYMVKQGIAVRKAARLSAEQIDALVRVDDSPAFAALELLGKRFAVRKAEHEARMSQALDDAVHFLNLGAAVIALIAVGAALLIVNQRRLTRARDELDEALRETSRANNAKSDFLSSMSHELRTPLNAVIGFAQLLEISNKDPLSDTQKTYARHIRKSGEHLLLLIQDVLDLAKIEAGTTPLSIEDVDVTASVNGCLSLVTNMADARGIRISVPGTSPNRYAVRADNTRLKQVMLNLMTNAIKYGSENGVVTVQQEMIGADTVRISVTDTGLPPDPADEAHHAAA